MKDGAIIILAWPEGMVCAAGAWYDRLFANKGKYRVGHSALVLIDYTHKKSLYFDFGRYHTPKGFGRVRDVQTDSDLSVIDPVIKKGKIINLESILLHVYNIKSTHGEGKMYASICTEINSIYSHARFAILDQIAKTSRQRKSIFHSIWNS